MLSLSDPRHPLGPETAAEQVPRVKEEPLLGRRKSQGQVGQHREGSHYTEGEGKALGEKLTFPRSHRGDWTPLHSEHLQDKSPSPLRSGCP